MDGSEFVAVLVGRRVEEGVGGNEGCEREGRFDQRPTIWRRDEERRTSDNRGNSVGGLGKYESKGSVPRVSKDEDVGL